MGIFPTKVFPRQGWFCWFFVNISVSVVVTKHFMVALWNRADHYIFTLWFLSTVSIFFFPRLISAVEEWMSAILAHMVWPWCEFKKQV